MKIKYADWRGMRVPDNIVDTLEQTKARSDQMARDAGHSEEWIEQEWTQWRDRQPVPDENQEYPDAPVGFYDRSNPEKPKWTLY